MAKEDVKLVGLRASPFVTRVQFALNLKSIDYEFVPENFAPKSQLLLKSNPVHQKVPVLIHAGNSICESLVIIHFIDEAWPAGHSILPAYPYDRAAARFWAAYADEKFFPALMQARMRYSEESTAEAVEKLREGVAYLEEAFVECSKGKGFFGGDVVGYLDLVLGSHLGWLRAVERMSNVEVLEKTKGPALSEWAERFSSHKAVKGTLPEGQELIDHHNRIMQAKAAALVSK